MRRVLREAALEAELIIASYGARNTFEKARMTQALRDLRAIVLTTWGEVDGITQQGVKDAAKAAALSERWMQDVLKDRLGQELLDWDRALGYSAENGILALLAKEKNRIPLSKRIYLARAWSNDQLQAIIRKGILLQRSANQIAKSVRGFINPNVPGGMSYAANRLARTEINNAFHTQQITSREDEPWTEAFHWNLSGSHRVPDHCNRYAEREHFRGGGIGNFRKGSVPPKPHPQCLCYLTTITIGEDEFIQGFFSGKYDRFIDKKIGVLPDRPSAGSGAAKSLREEAKKGRRSRQSS